MSKFDGLEVVNEITNILMQNSRTVSYKQAYVIASFAYSISGLSGSILTIAMSKIAQVAGELFKLTIKDLPEQEKEKIISNVKKKIDGDFFPEDKKKGGGILN